MEMKLELILLPAKDVDESIAFCRDKIGFHLDHDVRDVGGGVKYATFADPTGNTWELQEVAPDAHL